MGLRNAVSTAIAAVVLILASAATAEEMPSIDLSEPLTDEQCVRLALERNYSVLLAGDAYDVARAGRLQAWGGLLPTVSAGWNYTHSRDKGTLQDFLGPGRDLEFPQQKNDTRSYGFDVSQTLLSLPVLLNIAAEKRAARASEADIADAEQAAALAVRQQYFTLIESIKLLEVSQEDRRLAAEEQKRTESLFEVGSVARTDVLKARVRVAEAQSALIAAENTVDFQRGGLATALALPVNSPIRVIENLEPRAEESDTSAAYDEAAGNRPGLFAARLRLSSASASRKAALTAKLPYLSHRYSYDISNRPGDYDLDPTPTGTDFRHLNLRTTGWSYSIGVTWNVFDRLVTEGNIMSAKALESNARHQMQTIAQDIDLEVKEALVALRNSRAQIQTAREALVSAEEDLKLSQERYSVGLGTILELIDAQVKLTRARTGEVRAMAALKRAEAQLDRAVGRKTW